LGAPGSALAEFRFFGLFREREHAQKVSSLRAFFCGGGKASVAAEAAAGASGAGVIIAKDSVAGFLAATALLACCCFFFFAPPFLAVLTRARGREEEGGRGGGEPMMMGGEATEEIGTCETLLAGRQSLWRQKLLHPIKKKKQKSGKTVLEKKTPVCLETILKKTHTCGTYL